MGAIITGLVFLLSGAFVYAYNTESHTSKITFGRFGLNLGETETVAILFGLGVLFLAVGGWRWIREMGPMDEENEDSA